MSLTEIIMAVISGLFSVIWTLLKVQVARMQKDIDTIASSTGKFSTVEQANKLFELHDQDAIALTEVKMTLAGKHYERTELDIKFDKLDQTIKNGFRELSTDLKEMTVSISETYKNHIDIHHSNK